MFIGSQSVGYNKVPTRSAADISIDTLAVLVVVPSTWTSDFALLNGVCYQFRRLSIQAEFVAQPGCR